MSSNYKFRSILLWCIISVILTNVLGGCAKFTGMEESKGSISFDNEITGRLSEDFSYDNKDLAINPSEKEAIFALNNKTLRWGIARSPDNKTPKADPGAPEMLSKYGGFYLGDTSKTEIYLTFDEGYENGYTSKILDVLRANNVKAVFFITGPYLKDQQDLVRRMVEEGHEVGNHTINHPSLPEIDDKRIEDEISGLDKTFNEIFGKHMTYLRPPKGEFNERTLSISQKLGYTNLFWSFAYEDWYRDRIRGPEYAKNIVLRNIHNGAIILLHAVSKDNADALDSIIKGARENGYEFGNINKLCAKVL